MVESLVQRKMGHTCSVTTELPDSTTRLALKYSQVRKGE